MSAELDYLHERIDQLIRQTALEVGLLRLYAKADTFLWPHDNQGRDHQAQEDHAMDLTRQRFWAADAAAAEKFGVPARRDCDGR